MKKNQENTGAWPRGERRGDAALAPLWRRREWLSCVPALGLAACNGPSDPAPQIQPLRLAIDLWPGFFPAVLADELGWLAPEGVRLQTAFPANTDQMISDFSAGIYDVMGVSLGDVVSLSRGHLAAQVVVVSDESSGGDAVLARSGLKLDPERPLTIGTNLGGFGELFLQEFLRQRRLNPAHWRWVNADAAEVPGLLARGVIDIGHTWEPYVSRAMAQGAQRLFSSAETPGLVPDVLVVTQATLQRRAPLLKKFVMQWFRAVAWWQAHPERAAALIANRVHVAQASVSLQGLTLLDAAANRLLLGGHDGAAPVLAATVQRYSDFFVGKGQLAQPLDAHALVNPVLLP